MVPKDPFAASVAFSPSREAAADGYEEQQQDQGFESGLCNCLPRDRSLNKSLPDLIAPLRWALVELPSPSWLHQRQGRCDDPPADPGIFFFVFISLRLYLGILALPLLFFSPLPVCSLCVCATQSSFRALRLCSPSSCSRRPALSLARVHPGAFAAHPGG